MLGESKDHTGLRFQRWRGKASKQGKHSSTLLFVLTHNGTVYVWGCVSILNRVLPVDGESLGLANAKMNLLSWRTVGMLHAENFQPIHNSSSCPLWPASVWINHANSPWQSIALTVKRARTHQNCYANTESCLLLTLATLDDDLQAWRQPRPRLRPQMQRRKHPTDALPPGKTSTPPPFLLTFSFSFSCFFSRF